jgi:uncharacterized protein (TIGR03000 family)
MFKRGFSLAACGALALLLTAAESSPAQVFFSNGRGAFFGPGLSYPVGPTFVNYSHPYYYNPPPTYMGFQQYSAVEPTNIYYGAAMPMYYGNYYSSGVGTRAVSNVSEAAYATPAYPIQEPNYNIRYPVSPPLAAITDNTARVDVRLPADAELWFEGQKTSQMGTERTFRSPDLEPKQDYVYNVRARWEADGKPMDQTRKVTVHAGDHVVVDFPSSK